MAFDQQTTQRPPPYVGITGFSHPAEVTVLASVFQAEDLPSTGRKAMYGFLCSDKRLADPKVRSTKSPAVTDLAGLSLLVPPGELPMVHYHTPNRAELADEITRVFDINDLYRSRVCRAVQLNIDWPDPVQLQTLRSRMPNLEIVLQLPQRAMDGRSVEEIAQRASEYQGLATHALIDASGGNGILFDSDSDVHLPLLPELARALPNTRLGVAGGFTPGNIAPYLKLFGVYARAQEGANAFGPVNVDIQRRVRSADNTDFDFSAAVEYAVNAVRGVRLYDSKSSR